MRRWLRPYQRRLIDDPSDRIICLKSRRIGMSAAAIIRAILEASGNPFRDIFLTSISMREAKELLRRAGQWIEIFSKFSGFFQRVRVLKTQIEFPNGARVLALPALAVRSRGGTVILDEYAFQKYDQDVWDAIAPAADLDPDLRIIIISTPFGARGLFYEIWEDPHGQFGDWSRHKVTIHDAVAEGFNVDVDSLRSKYSDNSFAQEFECVFGTDEDQYFGHELLVTSQVAELPSGWQLYGGLDVASAADGTVLAPLVKDASDEERVRRVIDEPVLIKEPGKRKSQQEQFEEVCRILDRDPYERLAVDAMRNPWMGEELVKKYTHVDAWGVHEWSTEDTAAFSNMKRDMETGVLKFRASVRMQRALSRIQRQYRSNKTVKFFAPRNAEGHADEAFAAMLAYWASDSKDDFCVL